MLNSGDLDQRVTVQSPSSSVDALGQRVETWAAITGGTDTRVLFDDGGVVGEDSGFTWDKTNNKLTLTGVNNQTAFAIAGSPLMSPVIAIF